MAQFELFVKVGMARFVDMVGVVRRAEHVFLFTFGRKITHAARNVQIHNFVFG